MYRSSLKQVSEQELTSSLDLNYSRYLDFDNAVRWEKNGNSSNYTTTQKCMVFGTSGMGYNSSGLLSINNNVILQGGKSYNANRFSIDTLPVNVGTVFNRYEPGTESFGYIYFIPFIDQTIIVPDFSQMTDLSNMQYYNIPKDGILLGKVDYINNPYGIYINDIIFAGNVSSCIRYVTNGMTIAASTNSRLVNWYYIPMEE